MNQGFFEIPAKDYHADKIGEIPTLSHSCAVTMIRESPAHAYTGHPRLGGADHETNPAMEFGQVAHELILGQGAGFATWEGKTWAGKEAGAFWDRAVAAGLTPIKIADLKRAELVRDAFNTKIALYPDLANAFAKGISERVMIWHEGDTWMRAMCDKLFIDEDAGKAVILDLKTTEQAHPKAIRSRILPMGYALQQDFYSGGLRTIRPELAGRIKFYFLFMEVNPPFALVPCELSGEFLAIACSQTSRAISLWRECLKENRWPEYVGAIEKLEPKPYELLEEFGADSLGETMGR